MTPKRTAPPRQAESLATILHQVSQDLALDEKIGEMALLRLWPTVVPKAFVATSEAVNVRRQNQRRILIVHAANSATASQLSFSLSTILDSLNGYAQQTGCRLDRIDIKVAPLRSSSTSS